jgi:hypothetical protein
MAEGIVREDNLYFSPQKRFLFDNRSIPLEGGCIG